MIEAAGESTHVWSHQARITLFLSAIRHFADQLNAKKLPLQYVALQPAAGAESGLGAQLRAVIDEQRPARVIVCEPGEHRVLEIVTTACRDAGVPLDIRSDSHFLCSREEFAEWAKGRKELRMEFFYRQMRRQHDVLMKNGEPAGGKWNFDTANRGPFPKAGHGALPQPPRFAPDTITREVITLVGQLFPRHPGSLETFCWPVTRADALQALQDFIKQRLPTFGLYQDAVWSGMPFGWHSLLLASLNLKLLDPREIIAVAVAAWRDGHAPLAGVEGLVRQILGWREFIRGVYWLDIPGMLEAKHFDHQRPLPSWYWTGDTDMNCLRETITQTLRHGYAHQIQRPMVTGNFALLAGIAAPRSARVVSGCLRRCRRIGRTAQHRRHGAPRPRRTLHQQTLYHARCLPPAHEQLLRQLPI